eukprot:XP_006256829.1 PREDICTED: spindlin-2B-like [Rattus norvegicus]
MENETTNRRRAGQKRQMENETMNRRAGQKRQRRRSPTPPRRNIVGCRISHEWKEGDEPITHWKGTVVEQVPVNPSLYLVKYDGVDCVYGLELYKDKRVRSLKILSNNVGSSQATDPSFADTIIGKAVEHVFEGEDGSKDEWKGIVLGQAPVLDANFYVTYENDPVLYMYQLFEDYREGDLRILEGFDEPPPLDIPVELLSFLVGTCAEYTTDDGSKRVGMVIHQVEGNPSVFLVKFPDDVHIYVCSLVKIR